MVGLEDRQGLLSPTVLDDDTLGKRVAPVHPVLGRIRGHLAAEAPGLVLAVRPALYAWARSARACRRPGPRAAVSG